MFWFVLRVKRRNEIKIASQLEALGFQIFCPTVTTVKQWSDRKKKVIAPLINSYLFIKIQEKDRAKVFEVPGVLKYLFYLGKPAKVPNKEIELLQEYLVDSSLSAAIDQKKEGDAHIISSGPFKGKEGVIQEVGKNRLQVLLLELGVKVTLTKVA
ncbi:UpxY family transcription antiterminator [Lutibacter holmesii]|uniref:UpxY family transcription antiterminator n=1 Tax=Lutibacter holmesii TaxID=1137985 RepID=A0ABW3WRN9_9FLAO